MKEKIKVQTKFIDKNPLVKLVNQRFLSSIYELSLETRAEKILDCGCGEGIVINYLSRKLSRVQFEGFDIDQGSLNLAKKLNPKANFKKGSILKIPHKQKTFSLVLCTEVLEHLKDPEKALKELDRISSKYAIISVPYEPIFRISNMLRFKYWSRLGNTPGHINNWTPYAFKKLIAKYFRIEKELYPLPWMMFLVSRK